MVIGVLFSIFFGLGAFYAFKEGQFFGGILGVIVAVGFLWFTIWVGSGPSASSRSSNCWIEWDARSNPLVCD